MAIAFDAVGGGASSGSSFSHTCTGSNLILFVLTLEDPAGGGPVTAVTYNGVSMTNSGLGTLVDGTRLWYLYAPATGSNTVAVTGGAGNGHISASYSGAKQSGFPDSAGANTDTVPNTSIVVSTTVVASDCWFIGYGGLQKSVGTATTCTTSRTSRSAYNSLSAAGRSFATNFWDSNGTVSTGSQSQTTGVNSGGTYGFQAWGWSLAPYTAPPVNGNFLAIL